VTKVFVDSSVIIRLSIGKPLAELILLGELPVGVELTTSSYVLREVSATLSKDKIPPKARLACIFALGQALFHGWSVHLPHSSKADVLLMESFCRDKKDWAVLADAKTTNCTVLLTMDKDLLESTFSEIRCVRPEDWLNEFHNTPEFQEWAQQFADPTSTPVSP